MSHVHSDACAHGDGASSHSHGSTQHGGSEEKLVWNPNLLVVGFLLIWTILYNWLFDFSTPLSDFIGYTVWCGIGYWITGMWIVHEALYRATATRFFTRYVIICIIISLVLGTFSSSGPTNESAANNLAKEKIIHLDFKGAPLTVNYLKQMFPHLRKWGATGLLIEWEDTLPWANTLDILRSKKGHYKPAEVAEILEAAKENNLKVIPLLQSFGHLEFVLKHDRFKDLREDPQDPSSLCPIHGGSIPLIKEMMSQILLFHPGIDTIHLGGDEVWNLGTCSKCRQHPKEYLYKRHMIPLINHVKQSGLRFLLWDDMLRDFPLDSLGRIASLGAEPVVWSYLPKLDTFPGRVHNVTLQPAQFWGKYKEAFGDKMWAASAYKGALKPDTDFVPIQHHLDNHLSWMKLVKEHNLQFQGIILTGWSRFSHTAPLCELFPSSVPSLALQLRVLSQGTYNEQLRKLVFTELGLPHLPLEQDNTAEVIFAAGAGSDGSFPGHEVYSLIGGFEKVKRGLLSEDDDKDRILSGIASDLRQALSGIILPGHIDEIIGKLVQYNTYDH